MVLTAFCVNPAAVAPSAIIQSKEGGVRSQSGHNLTVGFTSINPFFPPKLIDVCERNRSELWEKGDQVLPYRRHHCS